MKKKLTFVFALFCLSCSNKDKLPPDVFPMNKMKMMVWDLEVAEQTASERFLMKNDSLRMESTSLYLQVFQKYKTDKAGFYKSMKYYETHPDILKILLDSASAYGTRKRTDAYKNKY
ncbi:MAG: DUF4296 domain-containing protein [Bacteroidota bacterium]|nr:DUF4296 domain-containing protein [Bacteroidota bacterium]